MKKRISYGINTQNRSMYPCTKELSQTVAVCHRIAVISFKYLAGSKSKKPYIYDVANGIPSVRNDVCVCYPKKKRRYIVFTQNTREEVRDLGNIAGCISADSGSHQTTYVCEWEGKENLNAPKNSM